MCSLIPEPAKTKKNIKSHPPQHATSTNTQNTVNNKNHNIGTNYIPQAHINLLPYTMI